MTRRALAFVTHSLRNLHGEAAIDSLRNVLSVIGAFALLGIMAAMRWFFVLPGAALCVAIWYADYMRHFYGRSI